jgi:hypothetical protein
MELLVLTMLTLTKLKYFTQRKETLKQTWTVKRTRLMITVERFKLSVWAQVTR